MCCIVCSGFEISGFRNLKNITISVFSEVFQRQTQRKIQRDKTMENTNGNPMENTKGNTWSGFTKRTRNDFPCGCDKSQRLLTRNSEEKKVVLRTRCSLFRAVLTNHNDFWLGIPRKTGSSALAARSVFWSPDSKFYSFCERVYFRESAKSLSRKL